MDAHKPVLLEEVLDGLGVRADGVYVDATYGRGGHALAILERLGPDGRLYVMDRDPTAVAAAESELGGDARVTVRWGAFGSLAEFAREAGLLGKVNGLLLDLGVSSPQLDDASRGFSFLRDGPLDMRMNDRAGSTAAQWLATASERDIAYVLRRFGEEPQARRIARGIVAARQEKPIERTGQLADLVGQLTRSRRPGHHPATRTFQALRIFINRELEELETVLSASADLLASTGRLCVISFHSLEDRIVKRFIRKYSRPDPVYAGLPDIPEHARPRFRAMGKAVRAGEDEIASNPRARSATLRTAERI